MLSTRPLISKSSSSYTNPLMIVHQLQLVSPSLSYSTVISIPSKVLVLLFTCQPGQQNPKFCKFSFFFFIIIRSGCLAEIWWSICISKSQKSLSVSFSRTNSGLCIYLLFIWSNFKFLLSSKWITFPTLVLCSLILFLCLFVVFAYYVWLIVSSLSPYNSHLLFCCVLSIIALIELVP